MIYMIDELFFKLHEGLPRQGPGSDKSTQKALELVTLQTEHPSILDIGCGPGMQTRLLARRFPGGTVTALDTYAPFLDQLNSEAEKEGLENIITREGSMFDLPFDTESFDLIWSEGAVYIMGFSEGLSEWKKFLKPGGFLAVSEIAWIQDNPPPELRKFWEEKYPAITTAEDNISRIIREKYVPAGYFILPPEDWFTHYYTPLETKIAQWTGDGPMSEQLLAMEKEEISLFRKFSDWYSYAFYVMKKMD